ncbi:transcription factor E2F7 isoform X2 [Nematostella vectensis]|uniref:transcription factor E2F7 isoform X2 n=1 Tax=Nematostella vectensis TaxID=45351 RepID=UPI002077417F|nr:transcription factor E2F7 isoform X2 [Nematostella vectensis]
MDFESQKDGLSCSIAPVGWEKATESSDSEESECNNSQPVPLARHSSLAEITTISNNCKTSPLAKSQLSVDEGDLQKSVSLELDSVLDVAVRSNQPSGTKMQLKSRVPSTPTKQQPESRTPSKHSTDEPLTPTANLKMLVSAASPAIRDREIKKRELFTDSPGSPAVVPSFALPVFDSKVVIRNGSFTRVEMENGSEKIAISRKDKSLGLLCQRFLAKYPDYPTSDESIEISLDEVAKDLGVERRRIYDIVNVLESVEVISRFAKNRYMWHGKTKLVQTLQRLKRLALSQGITLSNSGKENPSSTQLQAHTTSNNSVKYPRLLPKNNNIPQNEIKCFDLDEEELAWAKKQREADYCRKDKSLGVLSQKFLMMFLVSETRQVTLDDAANVLIDSSEEGQAKYKTKVRRLYDIANILSSLQLIQKVHIHNIQHGRKPGFRWIGMDLDTLDDKRRQDPVPAVKTEKLTPKSHQSLLAEIEDKEESLFGRLISRRPSQQQIQRPRHDSSKSKLPRSWSDCRHASKKRALSSDKEKANSEDGYSIQELADADAESDVASSPTAVKFQSELKKLQEQYPDRMSQLLSACRQGFTLPDHTDPKKSRRTLFTGQPKSDDEPAAKKSKPIAAEALKTFVHSATSPFKPIPAEEEMGRGPNTSPRNAKRSVPAEQASPEQKVLQERQKQQRLLEEQKDFSLQDERWKRMEQELDKAFSQTVPSLSSPVPQQDMSDQSSVGIQASLIEDVSPLKPLSNYYVKMLSDWGQAQTQEPLASRSATPSPVILQSMGVAPLTTTTPVSQGCESQSALTNSVTLTNLATNACHVRPLGQVTQENCATPTSHVTDTNKVTHASHVTLASQVALPYQVANQVTHSNHVALANQLTHVNHVTLANQVTHTNHVTLAGQVTHANHVTFANQVTHANVNQLNHATCNQGTVKTASHQNRVVLPIAKLPQSIWSGLTQQSSRQSQAAHPGGLVLRLPPRGANGSPLPISTMALPVSFVNSLINSHPSVNHTSRLQIPTSRLQTHTTTIQPSTTRFQTPAANHHTTVLQTPPCTQAVFGSPMANVQEFSSVATPILPKPSLHKQGYTSRMGETPSNPATFLCPDVAKALMLPEHN